MPYQPPPGPQIIAHRGNSVHAPENTLPAIEQAIALGVDMIEMDVNRSREGVPVLIHNHTLEKSTNGSGRVEDHTMEELKQLDAGSWKDPIYIGAALLTLQEGLEMCRNRVAVNIDLKTDAAIPAIISAIRDMHMENEVVITGCLRKCVAAVREAEPRLSTCLNMGRPLRALARSGSRSAFRQLYLAEARAVMPAGLNVYHEFVDEQLVDKAHAQGLWVWAWTVDNESRASELLDLGVDSITTNWPHRIREVMRFGRSAGHAA